MTDVEQSPENSEFIKATHHQAVEDSGTGNNASGSGSNTPPVNTSLNDQKTYMVRKTYLGWSRLY